MPGRNLEAIQITDYLHVKGVKLVEPGMPQWKLKPLREKNLQLINEYLSSQDKEEERQIEEEKWAAIPEWKRPLLREKEKKKKELEDAQHGLDEAERREREKFESLPQWKQRVLRRKKSVSEHDANSDTKSESSGGSDLAKSEHALLPTNNTQENGHTESINEVSESMAEMQAADNEASGTLDINVQGADPDQTE